MRFVLVSLLAFVGCSAPTDPTPNRAAPSNGGYPAGPYGYVQGSVIDDLQFIGKHTDSYVDYTTLSMQTITLDSLRQNPATKLILVDGAARWCSPCNQDQPTMRTVEANYAPKGVVTLEVVVEGNLGIPSTEDDINRWANRYMLSGYVASDPSYDMSKYADVTAFPLYMIVRASTMKIEYMQVGSLASFPIEPELDALLAQ